MPPRRSFCRSKNGWIRAVLILLGSASIILYIGQHTDLDLILADYYFDAAKGVFPWDHTWLRAQPGCMGT